MKQLLFISTMLLAFTVAPARAQTRVDVGASFGVPGPFVSGTVLLGEPPEYYHPRRPVVVYEEPRPWYYRPRWFVERRSYGWYRHHRHGHRWDDDRN